MKHDVESGNEPREIPWAGLFNDPGMIPAERLDEELSEHWADDLDHDRDERSLIAVPNCPIP